MNTPADFTSILFGLLFTISALAISISFHEAAHAWVALKLGDPTAKHLGRVSLNPFDHIDPVGTVILPLILMISGMPVFGWAKPTPFNPWNLQNPKRDSALISLAGPLTNLALAVIVSLVFRFTQINLLLAIVQLNLILAIFNLIPIHPLDGFKVVGGLLPKNLYYEWIKLERYGTLLLLALIFLGQPLLSAVISPLLNFFLRIFVG
jgi:Zn-dependent protease